MAKSDWKCETCGALVGIDIPDCPACTRCMLFYAVLPPKNGFLSRILVDGKYTERPMPWWYGEAWYDFDAETRVWYPIPLNVLIAIGRWAYDWLRHPIRRA